MNAITHASDECETIDKIAAEIASTSFEAIAVADERSRQQAAPDDASNSSKFPCAPLVTGARTDDVGAGKMLLGNGQALANGALISSAKDGMNFADVEDELAEMFAGIDDDDNKTANDVTKEMSKRADDFDDSTDDDYQPVDKRKRKSATNDSSDYAPTPKKSKAGRPKGSTNKGGRKLNTATTSTPKTTATVEAGPPAKRGRKKKTTAASKKSAKGAKKGAKKPSTVGGKRSSVAALEASAAACDSPLTATVTTAAAVVAAPRLGPFVHVRTDGSSNVINAPNGGGAAGGPADDAADGTKAKSAKSAASTLLSAKNAAFSMAGSDRSKIRGLHLSTLSTKYDADTTDTTWMCVFCKRGPHRHGLGDLFGPYLVRMAGEEFEQLVQQQHQQQLVAEGAADEVVDVWRRRPGGQGGVQRRTLPTTVSGCSSAGGSVSVEHQNYGNIQCSML